VPGEMTSFNLTDPIAFEIDDADRHAAPRIERQVIEPERAIESAHALVERMGQHAEANRSQIWGQS